MPFVDYDLLPNNNVLSFVPFSFPNSNVDLDSRRVKWRWDSKDDGIRVQFGVEVGFKIDCVFDSRFGSFGHDGMHSEGQIDVGRRTVSASEGRATVSETRST